MPRFIVVHSVAAHATQDDVVDGARKIMASMPSGAEWLNTWSAVQHGKVLCEWEAPDLDTIRSLFEASEAGRILPVETIYEVEPIDPQWFA